MSAENVDHILQVYYTARSWEREQGLFYYSQVHDGLLVLARNYGVYASCVYGAFAALSPNNDESGNHSDLRAVLDGVRVELPEHLITVHTYGANRTKAYKLISLHESHPDPLTILGGNKVRSFYQNLWQPTNPKPVTIDGHMVSVWVGRRLLLVRGRNGKESVTSVLKNTRDYSRIADDYRTAARELGILPSQLQSTCWLAWKRTNKILWNPQLKLWTAADEQEQAS